MLDNAAEVRSSVGRRSAQLDLQEAFRIEALAACHEHAAQVPPPQRQWYQAVACETLTCGIGSTMNV